MTEEQIKVLQAIVAQIGDVGGVESQVTSAAIALSDLVEGIEHLPDDDPLKRAWRRLGDAWSALYHAELALKHLLATTTK